MIELLLFVIAFGLAVTEWHVSYNNTKVVINGFGSLLGVRRKQCYLPMRYRVLVPWLVGWIRDENARLGAYLWLRLLVNWAGLVVFREWMLAWGCDPTLALTATFGLALALGSSFLFDYAEYAWEVLFVCLLYVSPFWELPWLPWVVLFVWALTKETAPMGVIITALIWELGNWDVTAIAAGCWLSGHYLVRWIQGPSTHYHLMEYGQIGVWPINKDRVRRTFINWRHGLVNGYRPKPSSR